MILFEQGLFASGNDYSPTSASLTGAYPRADFCGALFACHYRRVVGEVLANISLLIRACRSEGIEVIYIQHDGAEGDGEEPGTQGWEIYPPIGPVAGERVFRKRFNSAFRETDLRAYLEGQGIGRLLLVGIQTEYCVDTTCRVAFEYGYEVVIPEMANTTFDNGDLTAAAIHELMNRRLWDGRFARVLSVEEALEAIPGWKMITEGTGGGAG
mgnify:CR=1 FL=1